MIYKENNDLVMANEKVLYKRNGETIEQYVTSEGKEWWLDFAEKWEDMTIVEFVDVVYTSEQLARFEEVVNTNISEAVLNDYVMDGIVGEGLEVVMLKKENEELKQTLADLIETVLMGGLL